MASELWLQEPRNVIAEPGFGQVFDFRRDVSRETVKRWRKDGFLKLSGAYFEEVGGHFMPRLDYTLASMDLGDWTEVDGTWSEVGSKLTPAGGVANFLANSEAGDFKLQEAEAAAVGAGRYFAFICYDTDPDAGGSGTASPITLYFGGLWKAEFYSDGELVLYRYSVVDDAPAWVPKARSEWMTAETFATPQGIPHWLHIYEVRGVLVIRNLSASLDGRRAGLRYADPAPYTDEATLDANGLAYAHALRAGTWTVEGTGRFAFNLSPQKFVAGTGSIESAVISLGQTGSSMQATPTAYGLTMAGAEYEVTLTDEGGGAYPQGTGAAESTRYGISWKVEWTNTADAAFYLTGFGLKLPRVTRSDGNSGTDLLALANVADKEISLAREGDLTREQLSASLQTYQVDLAANTQLNMAVRFEVDGETVFRGRSNRASWNVIADTATPTGAFRLEAEGLWKRFRHALWPGGTPFDGRPLTECLAEVLDAAGLTSSDYSLAAVDYVLPTPREGEPPALVYRPGTNLDRILEDLAEKFYGLRLTHYFDLATGDFILAEVNRAVSSVATFYQSEAAARAAGAPGQGIRAGSYEETMGDEGFANCVAVIGESEDGEPLVAECIDWNSIRDSTSFNYIGGEFWWLLVSDPGLTTEAAVNYACRSIFDRARQPKVFASWTSRRLDVFPGDVVTISGDNYGSDYLITGVTLTQAADGDAADPAGLASYQGEKLL